MSSSSLYSLVTWKIVTITQISCASISLCASSAMAAMVASSKNGGLTTSYRRIIFGLCISDILQSAALIVGPLSVPSWINDSWGHGNNFTCQVNGIFLTFGSTSIPMYVCFLCLYYLYKLKYRMNDEDFIERIELKIHVVIIALNFILAGSGLALSTYNTGANRSFCYFAAVPQNCRFNPEVVGECDPVIKSRVDIFTLFGVILLFFVSLFAIITIMVILYRHANFLKRVSAITEYQANSNNRSTPAPTQTPAPAPTRTSAQTGSDDDKFENNEIVPEPNLEVMEQQISDLSDLYRKEMLIQATCYVAAFSLTYTPLISMFFIVFISSSTLIHDILLITATFFFTLGGLFNILVYTRPKVGVVLRKHPEYSRFHGLWVVLKAGGEVPDELKEDELFEDSSNDVNLSMPKSNKGNTNEKGSQSIEKKERGIRSEEDSSYVESDVVFDSIEIRSINNTQTISDVSISNLSIYSKEAVSPFRSSIT